jgi:hypothetical protein
VQVDRGAEQVQQAGFGIILDRSEQRPCRYGLTAGIGAAQTGIEANYAFVRQAVYRLVDRAQLEFLEPPRNSARLLGEHALDEFQTVSVCRSVHQILPDWIDSHCCFQDPVRTVPGGYYGPMHGNCRNHLRPCSVMRFHFCVWRNGVRISFRSPRRARREQGVAQVRTVNPRIVCSSLGAGNPVVRHLDTCGLPGADVHSFRILSGLQQETREISMNCLSVLPGFEKPSENRHDAGILKPDHAHA